VRRACNARAIWTRRAPTPPASAQINHLRWVPARPPGRFRCHRPSRPARSDQLAALLAQPLRPRHCLRRAPHQIPTRGDQLRDHGRIRWLTQIPTTHTTSIPDEEFVPEHHSGAVAVAASSSTRRVHSFRCRHRPDRTSQPIARPRIGGRPSVRLADYRIGDPGAASGLSWRSGIKVSCRATCSPRSARSCNAGDIEPRRIRVW
jgi:hypothetical protein